MGKTVTGEFSNNKQLKNRGEHEQFLMRNAHKPIIDEEEFEKVQAEISRRSNIEIKDGKAIRKGTHYCVKREKLD